MRTGEQAKLGPLRRDDRVHVSPALALLTRSIQLNPARWEELSTVARKRVIPVRRA